MKTLKQQLKPLLFVLALGFSIIGCSSDDDNNDIDNNDPIVEGNATAVIGLDNQTLQFSAMPDKSFATLIDAQIGENDIQKLVVVMMDTDNDLYIVAQASPAPVNPINYDLSNPLTDDYFFTTGVAVDGANSSNANTYGVGYFQGDDVLIQSSGFFKVTSISNTNLKGTFDMTLYNSYVPSELEADQLTATAGVFDLPIVELTDQELEDLGLD